MKSGQVFPSKTTIILIRKIHFLSLFETKNNFCALFKNVTSNKQKSSYLMTFEFKGLVRCEFGCL